MSEKNTINRTRTLRKGYICHKHTTLGPLRPSWTALRSDPSSTLWSSPGATRPPRTTEPASPGPTRQGPSNPEPGTNPIHLGVGRQLDARPVPVTEGCRKPPDQTRLAHAVAVHADELHHGARDGDKHGDGPDHVIQHADGPGAFSRRKRCFVLVANSELRGARRMWALANRVLVELLRLSGCSSICWRALLETTRPNAKHGRTRGRRTCRTTVRGVGP